MISSGFFFASCSDQGWEIFQEKSFGQNIRQGFYRILLFASCHAILRIPIADFFNTYGLKDVRISRGILVRITKVDQRHSNHLLALMASYVQPFQENDGPNVEPSYACLCGAV